MAPRIASLAITRSSCPRAASSGGGTWLSARSAPLAFSSPIRPVITCQAYGSEAAMQAVNAASSISPRRACSIRSGETVRDMSLPPGQAVVVADRAVVRGGRLRRGGQECVRAHDEARVDLGGEVLAGGGAGPGAGVPEVELGGLAGELRPVPDPGVCCLLERGEGGAGMVAEVGEAERAALFHGAPGWLVAEAGQQRLARVLAQERAVTVALDLVADDGHGDVVAGGVALPLPVDADALAGRLGDQEGEVEAGEHAGGERLGACGAVDYHVLARPVGEVVEVQLGRAGLGVVAGHAEVLAGERAGGHQPGAARRPDREVVDRVVTA